MANYQQSSAIIFRLVAYFAVALLLVSCGSGSNDTPVSVDPPRLAPMLSVQVHHSDIVFDATRGVLLASALDSQGTTSGVVSIDPATGVVHTVLPATVDGPPTAALEQFRRKSTLSLSSTGRFLYFPTRTDKLGRLNISTGALDFALSPPPGSRATKRVGEVVASRVDDTSVYVLLNGDSPELDSLGLVRDQIWQTQWLDGLPNGADFEGNEAQLAVRADDRELLWSLTELRRIQLGPSGPDRTLATITPAGGSVPLEFVARGILGGTSLRDPDSLTQLFQVPADMCAALPSATRAVCIGGWTPKGHRLFVIDLTTQALIAEWMAGIESVTIFASDVPRVLTPLTGGRVAISYGTVTKGLSGGPATLHIYADPAFN